MVRTRESSPDGLRATLPKLTLMRVHGSGGARVYELPTMRAELAASIPMIGRFASSWPDCQRARTARVIQAETCGSTQHVISNLQTLIVA